MAETIRDVTVRLRIEQVKAKLEVPGVKEAQKGVAGLNVNINKLDKSVKNTSVNIDKSIKQTTTNNVQLNKSIRQTTINYNQLSDSSLKAGEGFRTAGEGVFAFGRYVTTMVSGSAASCLAQRAWHGCHSCGARRARAIQIASLSNDESRPIGGKPQ